MPGSVPGPVFVPVPGLAFGSGAAIGLGTHREGTVTTRVLELKDIYKDYPSGDDIVRALKGITIKFRDSEFVSILGQSGCGKTTLLNIIGGLDHYTTGDLVINGRSTKGYNDKDWDTYRNHSIGFVFQSYNLIPHQTVLRNVELALTISGVSRGERTRRATEALVAVGLGDQLHKKPTQMSGGQMQRVAIARALVNDPDIVLADEPTGALDSETSVQVMEILKKVAQTKLVIMVTHNPDLAERYSTRIVRLLDGQITEDSNPYVLNVAEIGASGSFPISKRERRRAEKAARKASGKGKKRMSFFTALGLSMRNLATKKGRTTLTAFAGSIGIIGIALILSLSNGAQDYINQVEQDTLSSYPVQLQSENVDMSALMSAMSSMMGADGGEDESDSGSNSSQSATPTEITTNNIMTNIITKLGSGSTNNDLAAFREYLESDDGSRIYDLASDVRYGYDTTLYVYSVNTDDGVLQVNPSTILESLGLGGMMGTSDQTEDETAANSIVSSLGSSTGGMMSSTDVWDQLMNNDDLLESQYDVLVGRMPENYNEVVLITDKNGRISDYLLYTLGMKDQDEVDEMLQDVVNGEELEPADVETYDFDDFLGMEFKLVPSSDFYQKQEDGTWANMKDDEDYMTGVVNDAESIEIVGVIRPNDNAAIEEDQGALGYRADLMEHLLEEIDSSEVAQAQRDNPTTDIFTGLPFERNDDGTLTEAGQAAQDAEEAERAEREAAAAAAASGEATGTDATAGGEAAGTDATATGAGAAAEPAAPTMDDLTAYLAQLDATDPDTANYIRGLVTEAQNAGTPDDQIVAGMQGQFPGFAEYVSAQQAAAAAAGADGTGAAAATTDGTAPTLTTIDDLNAYIATLAATDPDSAAQMQAGIEMMRSQYGMTDDQIVAQFAASIAEAAGDQADEEATVSDATYEGNLRKIGVADVDSPSSIDIYAKDFDSKEEITSIIEDYNTRMQDEGEEGKVIQYTDYVGLMMSSVSTVIDAISYILIAFVAISLVVSSIMIGIITYISVIERTKEIGILRAIGASKRDVSRVFNAETFVIGLISGALGIGVTLLLIIPINIIVYQVAGVANLAALPWNYAAILIAISVVLTLIGGLIPAHMASKKDPVLALRTE